MIAGTARGEPSDTQVTLMFMRSHARRIDKGKEKRESARGCAVRVRVICTITVNVQFQCQRACVLADNRSSVIHQHGVYLARPAAENPDRTQQGNAALRKLRGAFHTGGWS